LLDLTIEEPAEAAEEEGYIAVILLPRPAAAPGLNLEEKETAEKYLCTPMCFI